MTTESWFDRIPLWCLGPLASCLLWAALEGGYRLGKWRHARRPDEREQPVGAMTGSIIGLLALVLGFTFSLAASRFDARRQMVLREANAIGTAYLRSGLLPQPYSSGVAELLREYAHVRSEGVQSGDLSAAINASEALHRQLWQQAVAAVEVRDSVATGLFIQSLNELIDLHAERLLVGLRSRIPLVIWILLLFLAHLGMCAVGYQAALTATRRSPAMLGLVIAFASVLYLIADLDRVQEGLLQVNQQAMIDVQRSMQPTVP